MSDAPGTLVHKHRAEALIGAHAGHFATLPFMLMLLPGRLARRVEARAAAKAALQTERPSP